MNFWIFTDLWFFRFQWMTSSTGRIAIFWMNYEGKYYDQEFWTPKNVSLSFNLRKFVPMKIKPIAVHARQELLHITIKSANFMFSLVRWPDFMYKWFEIWWRLHVYIKGFYHIKATACVWMYTCYMCIKTQYSYDCKVI